METPDHYRLLGIESFESDPDVIASAADRQMAHLRKYQTGTHAALSQQILNEIAAAKVCLLNVGKKQAYDVHLRSASDSRSVQPGIQIQTESPVRKSYGSNRLTPIAIITTLIVVVVTVSAVLFPRMDPNSHSTESRNEGLDAAPNGPLIGVSPTVASADSNTDQSPERVSGVTRLEDDSRPISPAEAAKNAGEPSAATMPDRRFPTPVPEFGSIQRANTKTPDAQPEPISTDGAGAASQTRVAAPNRASLTAERGQLERLIKQLTRRRPLVQSDIMPLLDHELVRSRTDLKFVLLEKLQDVAATNGSIADAWKWNSRIVDEFVVDAVAVRDALITRLSRTVKKDPVARAQLIATLHKEMWKCLRNSDFDSAIQLADAMHPIARNTGEKATIKWARSLQKLTKSIMARHVELDSTRHQLDLDPSNPPANEAMGRFHCFVLGDFARGLPYLAKAPDGILKTIATAEARKLRPAERKTLADEWWALSQQMPAESALHVRAHAADHYREIVFKIPLVERKQIWTRLAEHSYSQQSDAHLLMIVGTVWKVDWTNHPPWDRVEFMTDGRCQILSQKKNLAYTWELQSTRVVIVDESGARIYTLVPASETQVHCEKHHAQTNQLMSTGVGLRLR